MPKNNVSDPITDQEIAFARLILSGTMNDRRAAEAVGLNPETAAYTKAKPRVRAYMLEHRAAVREKLVDQEADGLRRLNLGRDQILTRLWELATLSHEATRGTIAGQIKALSMIVAIEGLVPSGMNARRFSPPATQPAPQVLHPEPAPKPTAEAAPKTANGSSFPNLDPKPTSPLNPFIKPEAQNHVPTAIGITYDAVLDRVNPIRLSFSPDGRFSGRRR
jgi:hypothetical protein